MREVLEDMESSDAGQARPTAPVAVPLMTVDAFAVACGLPRGVVEAQVELGYWPTTKVGKYRFVNVAALWQRLAHSY